MPGVRFILRRTTGWAVAAALLLGAAAGRAGVTVTQNVSPGATSWPGAPLLATVANPSTTSVLEGFNGVGGNTNLSETFTVTAGNCTLQAIYLYAGLGTGTGTGTNLVLKLFDLGTQTAPNPSAYAGSIVGSELLGSGSGLSISCTYQSAGMLELNFSGGDQLALTNGHLYAFELTGMFNTAPICWGRGTNDTYAGGAAYRNESWINGNSARDFAMAVYATPASTNASTNVSYAMPSGMLEHAFTTLSGGVNADGANPCGGLVLAGGRLCGTTLNGGAQGAGTVFYLAPDASGFNAFEVFTTAPGPVNPAGALAAAGPGLFGTSLAGGTNGTGAVFVGGTNGSLAVLRSLSWVSADNATNFGGASPTAWLVPSGGMLYGAATAGGGGANGTIFALSTNGSAFAVLHDFSALDTVTGTNADGAMPGGLALAGGVLYGVAAGGGAGGAGTVFAVQTNGANFTVLHHFAVLDTATATNLDGVFPAGGLIVSNGMLYGTTLAGGWQGGGTVFALGTNGAGFATLHHFSAVDAATGTNEDGALPCAALTRVGGGLYGTTAAGGTGGNGTVFAVSTHGGQFQILHAFSAVDAVSGTNSDGANPVAGLLAVSNLLYGTTFGGGLGGAGAVFAVAIPYPPAIITNLVRAADGSLTLSFLGGPNSTNVVQAAATLTPPVIWQAIRTNVADASGGWQVTDSNTNATRFYRSYAP